MGKVYPEEFREQAVELYRLDEEMTYAQVARDMGCSSESVRAWVEQAEIDEGKREGVTSEEKEENKRLRKQLRRARRENEILRKATAFFAREEL